MNNQPLIVALSAAKTPLSAALTPKVVKPILVLPDTTNPMKPTLVISYDDSAQDDYTLAFPVHQAHGVPGEVNAVSNFMLNNGGYIPDTGSQLPITPAQALEMQAAGWEFTVHGRNHLCIGRQNLSAACTVGGKKIYIPASNAHRWTHTIPYEVLVGTDTTPPRTEINNVVDFGTDETGSYLETENALQDDGYSYVRLSDDQMEDEIKGCLDDLTAMGLNVTHHTAPYSASNWTSRAIIKKYLVSARRGYPDMQMIPGSRDVFPTFELRSYVEKTSKTEGELDTWLDEVASVNGLSVMMEHTWRVGFSAEGLDYIIAGALARGIDVTTRTKALERFGNLVELGDPFAGEDKYEADQNYYVIDRAGRLFTNITNIADLYALM